MWQQLSSDISSFHVDEMLTIVLWKPEDDKVAMTQEGYAEKAVWALKLKYIKENVYLFLKYIFLSPYPLPRAGFKNI